MQEKQLQTECMILFDTQDVRTGKFPHVESLNVDGHRLTEERKDIILNWNF